MLKPSILIEMQITCNYQPENCSNRMNYFEVRCFFSLHLPVYSVLVCSAWDLATVGTHCM